MRKVFKCLDYWIDMDLHERVAKESENILRSFASIGYMLPASLFGAIAGAISGEIIDHLPYFNEAFPYGLSLLLSGLSNGDFDSILELSLGSTDKIGAVFGFAGGFVKTPVYGKSN